MRHFALALITALAGFQTFAAPIPTAAIRQEAHKFVAPPVAGLPSHLTVQCTIRDWDGKEVRTYPGKLCHYFTDGRLLAANDEHLALFDKDMNQLWRSPFVLHHMLTLTPDERFIYALGSEIEIAGGQRHRYDTVLKIDMKNGAELARFSTRQHIAQLKKESPMGHKSWKAAPGGYWKPEFDVEHTHGNTVFVLPKSVRTEPAYKAGNILFNMNQIGLVVYLDPDLKTMHKIFHRKDKYQQHDLQLLPNGNILSYVNHNETFSRKYSTLEEWDPETGKVKWQFKDSPSSNFYSRFAGCVQRLDTGHIFFTDTTQFGKYILITREGRRVWMRPSGWVNPLTNLPAPIQGAKATNLTEFLKNNRGV